MGPYGIGVAPPVWLHHPASLKHHVPGHPERPERLLGLESAMEANDWFGWRRMLSPPATRSQLLAVHPETHVEFVEALCAAGGGHVDMDTVAVAETFEAAARAAGGAVALVDAILGGEAPTGFSAHRPPGHHAEIARPMGFCFFNNVAVAAAHARDAHGVERVLVLDWDVHHGNGTEEIFYATPGVLFASIHQSPLYPGTGHSRDLGSGAGEGFNVNLPVPPGTGDAGYCSLVEHVVVPLARAYEPGLVLVSAGFDAHRLDPLASCRVTEDGFAVMTASLRRVCADLGVRMGLVLEGGYSVEALAGSVCRLAPVLASEAVPAGPENLAVDPLSEAALQRLEPWWPGLRGTTSA
jgi:acetoin utilization deacetylase AcuC-like enzyme